MRRSCRLKLVNYFHNVLHLRCLTGLWIRLWVKKKKILNEKKNKKLKNLEKSSFKANQVLHQLIFDVVGKVILGGHLYPLVNKAKKKSNQVSYLVSTHLIFLFSYALFMSWINETFKLDRSKTCRMLILGVINLCKGNFMPCIFYINTLKLYIQKHHKYINYSIFHDFIEIYSFVTNNSLFIMLEKCFSIAPTSFSKYIQNIKSHIECFSC